MRAQLGRGYKHSLLTKRIVISFDDETFDEIRAFAYKNKVSFAEQVRTLCEWGLEEERLDTCH